MLGGRFCALGLKWMSGGRDGQVYTCKVVLNGTKDTGHCIGLDGGSSLCQVRDISDGDLKIVGVMVFNMG